MSSLSGVLTFFSAIKAGIDLYFYFRKMQVQAAALEAEKRRVALQQAYDDLAKAKTEEEVFAAQKRVIDNEP